MHDPQTGGGYDGLTPDGPNPNQGAESTLAMVSTMQHARALATEPPEAPPWARTACQGERAMTMTVDSAQLATRLDLTMAPDDQRVVIKLFVPGEDAQLVHNRASGLIERILQLDEDETTRMLDDVLARFAGRHHDICGVFQHHYDLVSHRVPAGHRAVPDQPGADRRVLQPRVRGRGRGAVQPVDGAAPGPDRPGAR